MRAGKVNAVVVGADRVAANGMYLKTSVVTLILRKYPNKFMSVCKK